MAAGDAQGNIGNSRIACFVQLENETDDRYEGIIDFMDNRVDVNTGTVQIRGVIPNANGMLTPGAFARMRIPASAKYDALLVPDVAIGTEQNERFVSVVNNEGTVKNQPVKLGAVFGSLRAIVEGLKPGEAVIVSGLQQARPGAKVTAHEAPISDADLKALEKSLPDPTQTRPAAATRPSGGASAAPVGGQNE